MTGIKRILSTYIYKETDDAFLKKNMESAKFHGYYNTLISWMELLQNGKTIAGFFSENDTVAVYGMGKIGELICQELQKHNVKLLFGIDGNSSGINKKTGLKVYSANAEKLPEVDFIVISITYLSDKIIPKLEKISSAKIITIDELQETIWRDK